MSNLKKNYRNPKKVAAIELFALNPNMTIQQVADKLETPRKTVKYWRTDPNFLEACYDRYMTEFGTFLPSVLNSMVREAQAGNVQAARLVLEHSGKLVKNINVTIDSPFEKFLKAVPDAEIVNDEDIIDVMDKVEEIPIIESLPERDIEPPATRSRREKKQIDEALKKEQYSQKRKEWYRWNKRAKAVGVEPLSARRPTKGQRKTWEDEIIKRESNER